MTICSKIIASIVLFFSIGLGRLCSEEADTGAEFEGYFFDLSHASLL